MFVFMHARVTSMQHHRLYALLLKSPQKGLVPSLLEVGSRLFVTSSAATATMGSRRFFNTCLGGGRRGGAPIHEHDHVSFNQFPGLLVPGTDFIGETRRFLQFNPNNGSFHTDVNLPVPYGYACLGSAYGWLFLVGDALDTKLLNPFTGEEIQLPSVKTLPRATYGWMGINKLYVLKAVFSSDPSLQPAPLVLVIHLGDTPRLAYCKPGDISWSSLHHPHLRHDYEDAIFYNDQFYAISQPGYIMAYDIKRRTDDNDHSVEKTLIASGPKGLDKPAGDLYLVVLNGELIKLTRKVLRCGDRYVTLTFMIRRFVASENKWVKVESLGDHALFLGSNTSFSLRASEHPGCIPNAIYFTDGTIRHNQQYGSDMGVYNLSDQSITPLYPIGSGLTLPPPVFVTRLDMFRAADIPILFSGRQSLFASSSASHSSGETPQQKLKKKEKEKKCQIIRSSELQSKERSCDETYSTKVSLNQFPGLMFPGMVENSKTRRLLRVNDTGYFEHEQDVVDHSHRSELQVPHGHVCRGSAYGWLFLTDDNLDMKLLNPFSGAEIQLPSVKTLSASEAEEDERWLSKWFVYKAVFSANPSVEPRPVVLVIYGGQSIPRLAFCKPGDKGWTPLEFPKFQRHFQWCDVIHKDAVYHNGQFYVLSHPGYVAAFDIGRCIDDDDLSVKTTLVATAAKRELIYARDWYLVVLDGELVRFEFKKVCFDDCCIEGAKKRMEEERIRDGDTTDEYSTDEDNDVNYFGADEDSETEIETVVEDENDDNDFLTMSSMVGSGKLTIPMPTYVTLNTPSCVVFSNNRPSHTYGIKIRRFDESEQRWVKVESLGDKAVFLGYNTSFALSASDYPAGHCVPDSIYFTYSGFGNARTEMVCYDMGIYSVKDKIVKPLYLPMPMDDASKFKKPAPIWIVNSADSV